MNTVADLGYPILVFIMVFWTILAIAGILTTLVKQGKISGRHWVQKYRSHHDHELKA